MIDRRQLYQWTWTGLFWGRVCGVILGGMLLAVGVAAEKKSEADARKNEPVQKADKPPLGQITVLVPSREFKREGPAKAARVSFDDIDIEKVLNTKKLSLDIPEKMPAWLRKLDGQRIRLRGYMHPQSAFQESGIKRFVLCRDTSVCCFGPNPTVYYLVETTLKSGTTTNYIENKAFDVEGIFRIEPEVLEGTTEVDRFYYLDDAQVVKK